MSRKSAYKVKPETWISVDTETSGPAPGVASLLSIGASVFGQREQSFYVELRPVPGMGWSMEAEWASHRLSREYLESAGLDPHEAMTRFADWIAALPSVVAGARPIMLEFNTFDWAFVLDYFWRFYGSCPFSISALDTKSCYFGLTYPGTTTFGETVKSVIYGRNGELSTTPHSHNALDDATGQAELMASLLERARAGTLR
jgi:DNA polymerase III epsilon subunit-like protein